MGDRANVLVKDREDGGVWLYTHWSGTELAHTVRDALQRAEGRWTDFPYLTRIVFDDMTGCTRDLTGFGISTRMCDNGHRIIVLSGESKPDGQQIIAFHEEANGEPGEIVAEWTFAEYVLLTDDQISAAYDKYYEPETADY